LDWQQDFMQNVTTNNYDHLTELHTTKITVTTVHIQSSQFAGSSPVTAWLQTPTMSSISVLTFSKPLLSKDCWIFAYLVVLTQQRFYMPQYILKMAVLHWYFVWNKQAKYINYVIKRYILHTYSFVREVCSANDLNLGECFHVLENSCITLVFRRNSISQVNYAIKRYILYTYCFVRVCQFRIWFKPSRMFPRFSSNFCNRRTEN
jgi:hypothetical protein